MGLVRLSLVWLFAGAAALPANAAVRECRDIISSEIAAGDTELNAKIKAIEQWQTGALKFGQGFNAWRLAYDKSLQCYPKGSAFECVAIGRPCMINQTPGKRLEPLRPKVGI